MKPLLTAVIAAMTVLAVLPQTARAAQRLVVIEAYKAEGYTPGVQLKADREIELAAGARLSLLNETGRIIVLNGPYSGKADNRGLAGGADDAGTVMSKLSKLIAGQGDSIGTGASRNIDQIIAGKAWRLPHPSFMSVMTAGRRCALSRQPELWRADAARTEEMVLTTRAGKRFNLSWPAEHHRIDLPAELVADGTVFTASIGGRSVELSLHVRPRDISSLTGTMAWMADVGCTEQATALLNAMLQKAAAKE